MENAEDQQDVLDAQVVQAEMQLEEAEFNTAPTIQLFDETANEDFANLVSTLRPFEQYAVRFIANQLQSDDEEDEL